MFLFSLLSLMCVNCRATCGLCGTRYENECVSPSNDRKFYVFVGNNPHLATCHDTTDCSQFISLCNQAGSSK